MTSSVSEFSSAARSPAIFVTDLKSRTPEQIDASTKLTEIRHRELADVIECDRVIRDGGGAEDKLWALFDGALAKCTASTPTRQFPTAHTTNHQTVQKIMTNYQCDVYQTRGRPTLLRIKKKLPTPRPLDGAERSCTERLSAPLD